MSDRSKLTPATGPASGTATANAPSIGVPLRFILTGLLALLGSVALVITQPEVLSTYHYNQYVIAVTHLVVLGWIGSVVMGATYQLVPVALEVPLYSERLARWQYVFQLVGVAGMVWMFWTWNLKQVGHFGSVFAVGVLLFAYNIGRTLLRVPRWNVIAVAVSSTLFWLCLTVLAGLLIAAGKCSYESAETLRDGGPLRALLEATRNAGQFMWRFDAISAMHAHAHAGVLGIFLMLIVGVSYRLVPMFTLSELQNPKRALASVVLLNTGLAGCFVTIALRSPWKMVFASVVVGAFALYGWELWAILRARKRRALDLGVRSFLSGVALIPALCAAAVFLNWPGLPMTAFVGQVENAYGFLGLFGVVSLAIIGMLYKILPFLVWYSAYSRRIGLVRVPNFGDLYSSKWQLAGFASHWVGLIVTTVGILAGSGLGVRTGASLLGFSVVCLLVNTGKMLGHLFRPITPPALAMAGKPGPLKAAFSA